MAERQSLGVPILHLPRFTDPEVQKEMTGYHQELVFWLGRMTEAIDSQAGLRGTPTFYQDVDVRGNRLTGLGAPQSSADAVRADLVLRRANAQAPFDAEGARLENVQDGSEGAHGVNVRQLLESERNIRQLMDTRAVQLANDQTITGLKTFSRAPGAPFAVTAGSAKVAHLDADMVDGQGYGSGTFVITATGFSGVVDGMASWVSFGAMVVLCIPTVSGASNATTFTLTGMPAEVQTARDALQLVSVTDGSVEQSAAGILVIRAGGAAWEVYKTAGAPSWNPGGTKALLSTFVTYHRN